MEITKTFLIPDISCYSCVNSIEKDVETMKGVYKIVINFALNKAEITFDSTLVSAEDIVKQIKATGYTAKLVDKEPMAKMEESNHEHHKMEEEAEDHDHSKNENEKEINSKLYKVVFGAILSIIIVILTFWVNTGYKGIIMLVFTLAILFYTGRDFYIKGMPSFVLKGRPNMDTLVSLGVSAAFLYSGYVVLFTSSKEQYFMDAAIIATFIMFGRYLEAKAKGKAGQAIKKLLEMSAKVAHKIVGKNKTKDIPIDQVQKGDELIVKPGEKIPVDGAIIDGEATIDESMVTGESIPVDKKKGDKIIGATINGNTSFTMKTEKVGKETMLSQIIKLVEQAQMHKAPIQKLVDVVANYFVWGVIVISIITFSSWYFLGGSISQAIIVTVAVLIIACPCALGLATPISIVVGSGKGASMGILIKKAESLEKMKRITIVCFDKTGTITEAKPKVTDFIVYEVPEGAGTEFTLNGIPPEQRGHYENQLIQYIASLEHKSEHPLAKAVTDYAEKKKLGYFGTENVKAVTGKGISGKIKNQEVIIGNMEFMESKKITRCAELDEKAGELSSEGKTVLFFAIGGRQRGILALQDKEKENSRHAIELLHKRGIKTLMMTGDNEKVAKAIAKNVGINEVLAKVTPTGKTAKIKELQEKGEFVAMVGDGINDAPALATADVGIAIGTGTDVAIESGDIVLAHGDLSKAVEAIELSKATFRNIKQNLFWAFIYNSIGIPVAAFGLLNPIFSAGAMAFSSVSVVLNALRLKRFKAN